LRLRRIHRFLVLKGETKKGVLWAAFLMGAIRLGFLALSFQRVQEILDFISQRPPGWLVPDADSDEISWAVQAAGSALPGATCLVQALAANVLLAWRNQKTALHIGVARPGQDALRAHAWLESQGKIVIGDDGVEEFKPLPCFDGARK
jgi:hypothetical protein